MALILEQNERHGQYCGEETIIEWSSLPNNLMSPLHSGSIVNAFCCFAVENVSY